MFCDSCANKLNNGSKKSTWVFVIDRFPKSIREFMMYYYTDILNKQRKFSRKGLEQLIRHVKVWVSFFLPPGCR